MALEPDLELSLPADLTPAERAVAALVVRGHSNAEIARLRGSRARTVANQLRRIFLRLQVQSRAELLATLLASC